MHYLYFMMIYALGANIKRKAAWHQGWILGGGRGEQGKDAATPPSLAVAVPSWSRYRGIVSELFLPHSSHRLELHRVPASAGASGGSTRFFWKEETWAATTTRVLAEPSSLLSHALQHGAEVGPLLAHSSCKGVLTWLGADTGRRNVCVTANTVSSWCMTWGVSEQLLSCSCLTLQGAAMQGAGIGKDSNSDCIQVCPCSVCSQPGRDRGRLGQMGDRVYKEEIVQPLLSPQLS